MMWWYSERSGGLVARGAEELSGEPKVPAWRARVCWGAGWPIWPKGMGQPALQVSIHGQ